MSRGAVARAAGVAIAGAMAMAAAAALVLPPWVLGELASLCVLAIAALGLMVLVGWSGQPSLGHSAFIAIGAYAQALLLSLGWPFVLALPASTAIAGLAGLAIGLPAARLAGHHLAIATMAFALIVEHVLGAWSSLTGGHAGLPVADARIGPFAFAAPGPFFLLCLVCLALAWGFLARCVNGAAGRAWTALHEQPLAAQALGVPPTLARMQAFAVSAAACGLAGALMAHQLRYVTPDAFGLMLSLQLLLMVFVGGRGHLAGAVLGAVVIGLLPPLISELKTLLPTRLASRGGIDLLIHGTLLVAVVVWQPAGLHGWVTARLAGLSRRAPSAS